MGLITKGALEDLITRIKAEMTTKSDIIALRNALSSEAAARKAADKVRALSTTNITSEVVGQEIKWTIQFGQQSADGMMAPYVYASTSYSGIQGKEMFEVNARTIEELNTGGLVIRTPLGVSVTRAVVWLYVV